MFALHLPLLGKEQITRNRSGRTTTDIVGPARSQTTITKRPKKSHAANGDSKTRSTNPIDLTPREATLQTKKEIQAMEKVRHILGKFLTSKLPKSDTKRSWLVTTLHTMIKEHPSPMKECNLKFNTSAAAISHNDEVFAQNEYNYSKVVSMNPSTIISPGIEFRSEKTLNKIWENHKDWKLIKDIIFEGADYPCNSSPTEEERQSDLEFMIKRGNHPSTAVKENHEAMVRNYDKEVKKGWMIPISLGTVRQLDNARIIPVGVVSQWTIDKEGNRTIKRRLTHDCTFSPPSGHSINNDIDKELIDDCMYGHCLRRVLHGLHSQRLRHPKLRILLAKIDLDAAYRRLIVNPKWAVTSISIVKQVAYLLTRIPFGVSSGPSRYCRVSEAIFDLIYDLFLDETWDPSDTRIEQWDSFTPVEMEGEPDIHQARPLMVETPDHDLMCDGFIDDGIMFGVESKENNTKLIHAGPLVVEAIFRVAGEVFDYGRDPALSAVKLAAELQPDTSKLVLGWLIDTIRFRIYLPVEKCLDWSRDIRALVTKGIVRTKELESTIGRLNHAGHILPLARYFLPRLRYRLQMCKKWGKQQLAQWDIEDLHLWLEMLKHASQEGVSINNVTFTIPTHVGTTDACETGMGGYMDDGTAWRYQLPYDLHGIFTINLLEFMAAIINIWLLLQRTKKGLKIMNWTDSSSALGWLHHSTFNPVTQPMHDIIARHLANILLDHDSTLYSQHVAGKQNAIADSLSRDTHIPDSHLVFALKSLYPQQIPSNFHLMTLPKEIVSWVYSLKALKTVKTGMRQDHRPSKLGAFLAGNDSWQQLESKISTLTDGLKDNEPTYSAPLQPVFEEICLGRKRKNNWQEAQLVPPSRTYVRPFGRTFGTTRL